jgi:hypothetical protein
MRPRKKRRSRLAYEALRGTGTAADVLVCTPFLFRGSPVIEGFAPGHGFAQRATAACSLTTRA